MMLNVPPRDFVGPILKPLAATTVSEENTEFIPDEQIDEFIMYIFLKRITLNYIYHFSP